MPRSILYLIVLLVSAGVTFGLSTAVWRLSKKYRLYPKIRARDVHTRPTPRLGGIAMFLGMLVAMGVASLLPPFALVFGEPNAIIGLAIASAIVVGVGVMDDVWDLDWTVKLAAQILAAGVLAWQGIQLYTLPIGGQTIVSPWISLVATIVAVVLVMNAVNFIDGLDGLVAGVATIAGGVFFVYAYLLQSRAQTEYFNLASLTTVVLVGACLGFLPLNWHPAKLFMGDAGSMLVGLMMAASTISITGRIDSQIADRDDVFSAYFAPAFIPLLLPLAVLAVPLLDFALAVIRRMAAGKSPFSADRKHLHHRLLDMGHTHLGAVLILYMWTFLAAVGVLLFMFVPWFWAAGAIAVAGVVCVVATFLPLTMSRRESRKEELE
ncbi:MAG: undecaprenyl/decaprenyl-phosphate alpha-N-acetylglucosaminyl 1-phosphate transferase [Microbacteriaceae bacterium]|nr:undecaprenyl/decaprenyl-phosphate alpha-N-acetylglucosaminyl 1-phosphate transferase [Microbacteriaceae bacterium]